MLMNFLIISIPSPVQLDTEKMGVTFPVEIGSIIL